jgi:hypothetical protein
MTVDGSRTQIPDGIGPIYAYRGWYYTVQGSHVTLRPVTRRVGRETTQSPWDGAESGWVVATCARADQEHADVPDQMCTCGFYSAKTVPLLLWMVGGLSDPDFGSGPDSGSVLGRIELAGKIIEHDHGYRSERARIVELIPRAGQRMEVRRLARLLGLRVGKPAPPIFVPPPPFPPNDPAAIRLPVREWVQDAA